MLLHHGGPAAQLTFSLRPGSSSDLFIPTVVVLRQEIGGEWVTRLKKPGEETDWITRAQMMAMVPDLDMGYLNKWACHQGQSTPPKGKSY